MKNLLIVITILLLVFGKTASSQFEANNLPDGIEEEKTVVKIIGQLKLPSDGLLLNGDCSDFIDLSGMALPIEVRGTTIGATNDYGPFPERPTYWLSDWYSQSSAGPDISYKWTAPVNGSYTISICETNYDNCLMVYRFTCPDEPTTENDFIFGCDDICDAGAKFRHISLSQGEEILIIIDGYGNNSGQFELRIHDTVLSPTDLDWFIESQMETYHVPGVSAAIVKDGVVDWTGQYGYADIANNIMVGDTTLFMLASISKTVTGTAVMQLWEDSLFNLDDDINYHLPFSVRNPNYPTVPITFRMLMSHTSSINDWWNTLNAVRSWDRDPEITLDTFMVEYLVPGGIYYNSGNYNNWAPGEIADYSNIGVALTAYLLEEISPAYDSFAQYCNDNVFTPLDMYETSWYLDDLNINNIAMPYSWNGSDFVPYQHYNDPWFPSASLRTSAPQLSNHLISFMQNGQYNSIQILESATVDTMRMFHYPSLNTRGLFWYRTIFGMRYVWGHGGSYYGVKTRMFFHPEENTGVIVLTNGESSYMVNVLTNHLFEFAAGPTGFIAGVITDGGLNPIDHVYTKILNVTRMDFSDTSGQYYIGGLITGDWYDVRFRHPDFGDIYVYDISVITGDTTFVNITLPSLCDYVVGDINNSGGFNGLDVTYGVAYFKGGTPPPYDCVCTVDDRWYVGGDVNGSCTYNGLDITYGVSYFKGGSAPIPCADCPPITP